MTWEVCFCSGLFGILSSPITDWSCFSQVLLSFLENIVFAFTIKFFSFNIHDLIFQKCFMYPKYFLINFPLPCSECTNLSVLSSSPNTPLAHHMAKAIDILLIQFIVEDVDLLTYCIQEALLGDLV